MIGDKTLRCDHCKKDIFLPGNKIGGYWHLNGYTNPHGVIFRGGYCSYCVHYKLDQVTQKKKEK